MMNHLIEKGCRARGSYKTQFYTADNKEEAIKAKMVEDERRAPPAVAPTQLRMDGFAGFALGCAPGFFENPKDLVRALTRCIVLKRLRKDHKYHQTFAEAGAGAEFDPGKITSIEGPDEEKATAELVDEGALPVYLADKTQCTREARVGVTFLLPNAEALAESVRALLTYSSLWQAPGARAVTRPDRNYKYVPGETGQGTRQGAAAGAPARATTTELRLQRFAEKEVQLASEKGSQQMEVKMQAKLDAQQVQIDDLRDAVGKVVETTKVNTEEIKTAKTSIESMIETKMGALAAAEPVLNLKKGTPEQGTAEG